MVAESAASAEPSRSRRSLLRAGLAGLAGLALGALGRPRPAEAAAGGSIVMGASNSAGTTNTSLTTDTDTGTAFLVTQNGTATALRGVAGSGIAGFFTSANGSGVSGVVANKDKYGVYAANDAATPGTGAALRAAGKQNNGLVATADAGDAQAIWAKHMGTGLSAGVAIVGLNDGALLSDVPAELEPPAIGGLGTYGVMGLTKKNIAGGAGVLGIQQGTAGIGVYGGKTATTGTGVGVFGHVLSAAAVGIVGANYASLGGSIGIAGQYEPTNTDTTATGVLGAASAGAGVRGTCSAAGGAGVKGYGSGAGFKYGVWAEVSGSGYAYYGVGASRNQGNFDVVGALTKSSGSFKIDHPLDPAGKYLYHSFVESPDMKNVYDGVATLDAKGEATVTLPDWFEALNRDLRYQLTPVGGGAPELHVRSKVKNGSFAIGGGRPNQEVCWQVTGIRQDAYAKAHPIPVEEPKPVEERGLYLHPVEHGAAAAKGIDVVRHATQRRAAPAPKLPKAPSLGR